MSKKRSRSPSPHEHDAKGGVYKQRRSSKDAREVALLPSTEELLERVSPTVRHRFSNLIEAEICALQDKHRPIKPKATVGVAHAFPAKSTMSMAMLTEQITSTPSIY